MHPEAAVGAAVEARAPKASPRESLRSMSRLRSLLPTLAVHGLVAWLYVWLATGGTYQLGSDRGYYGGLADAFLAGQLHLKTSPSPELLALPNPYDAKQNDRYRLHDAVLYDGKYYLYWGPVPAVVRAAWQGLTGLPLTDTAVVLIFGLGGCLWFWLLARELRDRAFPDTPEWLVLLVYLCYALGGVSLYLQARPVVYHEAILVGSFFVLGGFYLWLRALVSSRSAAWQFALAGLLLGFAFGSRMTLIGYPLGAGVVLVWQWLRGPRRRAMAGRVLAFGLPSAGMLALLLLYNYARFGSIAEFGLKYQLTWIDQNAFPTMLGGTHPATFRYNLAAYLLFVPSFLPYYPFMMSGPDGALVSGVFWAREPGFASSLLLAPLIVFASLSTGLLTPLWRRPVAAVRAFVVAGSLGALYSLAVLLVYVYASVRYVHDFVPIACLLGGLGLWWLYPHAQARPGWRLCYRILGASLLVTSLAMGLSLAMTVLSLTHQQAYLRLAYGFDRAVSTLVQRAVPHAWPASYFKRPVVDRPLGTFYVEGTTFALPNSAGEPVRGLEVDSLFSGATRMVVEINDRVVRDQAILPGRQVLPLENAVAAPSGALAVRLHFPDQDVRPPGFLWPLRVGPLR